jgi:hypothetical protein
MSLPHFTNISKYVISSTQQYVNKYEMDIKINGETHLVALLKYDDDLFSFDCDIDVFNKLNTLHMDSFSFKVNVYNSVGDLFQRIYYSGCNYSEFQSDINDIDFYSINMRVKYFKETKVPVEYINRYERERKLERIIYKENEDN